MKESLAVWNIKSQNFPQKGAWKNKLKFLVRYGILAPSGHNSQPWKFKIRDNKLTILPDFERKRMATDPEYRELFISLGAAVKNIEIAADYFGLIYDKKYNETQIELEFKNGVKMVNNKELFGAITKRQTNRNNFKKRKISKNKLLKIGNENLIIISQKEQKNQLAKLVYGSDVVWFQSKELTNELDRWLSMDIEGKNEDRLPGITMVAGKLLNKKLIEEAPIAIIIGSKKDSVIDWIKTGENYEEMALKLTSMELSHSFFNSIVEIESRRRKLEIFCQNKIRPQLVIRVGWTDLYPKHTPRRNIKEVLV